MDLAALAFSIDSSGTLKAVQALDQLRQTTAATTDANKDFQTQNDFLVTSMGSTGAGAARLSRQLGEIGDRFGELMSQAEKARQAFDGSASSFDAWDIAQNKVEALGRAYGTTARGLDSYLQTANQLQMSSTQAAASVQRLTMALENQGAAAANIRQVLTNNGVSINDLQTDQIDTLLTRIKGAFQSRPDTQQRTSDLRTVLGTFDPDVIGTFTNTNYVPVEAVEQRTRANAYSRETDERRQTIRSTIRTHDTEDAHLGDIDDHLRLRDNLGPTTDTGHVASSADLALLQKSMPAGADKSGPSTREGRIALGDYVNSIDLHPNPNYDEDQGVALTGDQRNKQDLADLARKLGRREPNMLSRLGTYWQSGQYSDNRAAIGDQYNQDVEALPDHKWYDIPGRIGSIPGIIGAQGKNVASTVASAFGYGPNIGDPAPKPVPLDELGTGVELSALGDNRIQKFQSARELSKSLGALQSSTSGDTAKAAGDRGTAALATFVGAFGEKDGRQNFLAAKSRADDATERAQKDDGAVQDASLSLGLSKMSLADSSEAKGFIAYARERGVPTSALAGRSLKDMIDPDPASPGSRRDRDDTAPIPLPAGLLDNFKQQRNISIEAQDNEIDRSNKQEMGNLGEQAGIAGTGSANLQDLITYQGAYQKALQATNDVAKAQAQANAEVAKSEAERVVQIKASIGAMEEQNRQAAAYNDTMGASENRVAGADRTASGLTAQIQQQVDQQKFDKRGAFSQDDQDKFVAAKKDDLGNQGVKDAQDQTAAAAQELQTQQKLLGVAGDRAGVQLKMSRDIQVDISFQKDLAEAQASGDSKKIENITAMIAQTKRWKDAIAEVNLEAKAFTLGRDAKTNIQESIDRMNHRPEDRPLYDALRPVRDLQRESQTVSTGSDGSAAGVGAGAADPVQRAFLQTIAGPESGGRYNVRYTPGGGATFGDLSQHPNIAEPTPDGQISTAAGAYQITDQTWVEQQKRYGYSDYQPATQDKAAWQLASDRYKAGTKGGDLETDLLDPDKRQQVASVLKPTWAAIKPDQFGSAFQSNLHGQPGSTAMPNQAQNATAIADATAAVIAEHAQKGNEAVQEIGEQDARGKRAFDAAAPFVASGDQVGARMAQLGQVNAADPRGAAAAAADAQAKQLQQERDYANQLAATKAATDITITSNQQLATAYGTSTKAVEDLQDKLKVEAEARTTRMSALDQENRLVQLNAQRITEQTVATEQQAKAMRDSTSDQKAVNDLGPLASERDISRLQTQQDIDKHNRENPYESSQAKDDYATSRNAQQAVKETTDSIGAYKQAWEGAQSASFSALNDVVLSGGKAVGVVQSLVKSLAQVGLNSIEKTAGSFLSSQLGGLLGGGGATASVASAVMGVGLGGLYAQGGAFVGGQRTRVFAAGGLIDRPTNFYSAGGETNLAGEMGTEAIMPLKRMPNGDLGVSMGGAGSSGGAGVTVHAPITIQGNGNGGGGSSAPDQKQLAQMQSQLQEAVRQAVVSAIADEKRAGGSLY